MPSSVLSRVAADPATRWIALGWGAFIAENVVLCENRDAIILALGGDEAPAPGKSRAAADGVERAGPR